MAYVMGRLVTAGLDVTAAARAARAAHLDPDRWRTVLDGALEVSGTLPALTP